MLTNPYLSFSKLWKYYNTTILTSRCRILTFHQVKHALQSRMWWYLSTFHGLTFLCFSGTTQEVNFIIHNVLWIYEVYYGNPWTIWCYSEKLLWVGLQENFKGYLGSHRAPRCPCWTETMLWNWCSGFWVCN